MKRHTHQLGFSLTELAVVLVILALVATTVMPIGSAFIDINNRKTTITKLAAIESAFVGYVAINGRLPCPADGTLSSTDANAGKELGSVVGCTNNQINGVVPWVTIGISEADASDEWNMRITYRAGNHLWVANGMDMNKCDPAGTEAAVATPKLCSATCSASNLTLCTPPNLFLQSGKGISIRDAVGGNVLMDSTTTPTGGAAYVLISHGKNAAGGFHFGGGALTDTSSAGSNELSNSNGTAIAFPGTYFVDREPSDSPGAAYFDDIVVRPSIMKVAQQAQRGPRAH